jgi:hypothetical protein
MSWSCRAGVNHSRGERMTCFLDDTPPQLENAWDGFDDTGEGYMAISMTQLMTYFPSTACRSPPSCQSSPQWVSKCEVEERETKTHGRLKVGTEKACEAKHTAKAEREKKKLKKQKD